MKMNKRKFLLVDIVLILGAILLDQITKYLAVVFLKEKPPIVLIPDVFELRYLENSGAAFGMLQDKKIFFIIITVVILMAIAYLLAKMPSYGKYRALHILAAFVAAGAVGNMLDRIRLDYVVDFFYISLINFPIFNVADICVSVSFAVAAVLILFSKKYRDEDFDFLKLHSKKAGGKKGEENV